MRRQAIRYTILVNNNNNNNNNYDERIICPLIQMRISADSHMIKKKLNYCNTHMPCNRTTAQAECENPVDQ